MTILKKVYATAAAAVLMLSAACGSDDGAGSTTTTTEDGVTKLKVGYIPVGIYSYFWRAQEAGYFEDENLEVELVPMSGGGEIIPALQSGTLDFGISDALGVLNARNQDIPATYVSFNFVQSSEDPVHAVLTGDESVKEPADLAGETVATNLSYNTDWTMMREWLRQNDVDVDSVKFQELPFPDMLAALRDGTVAAAGVTEPFYTQGENDDLRVLGNYFTDVKSPIVVSGVAALSTYIEENEQVVERFVSAIDHAIEDFRADPQVARDTIAANTDIDPAVVKEMHLGTWDTSVDVDEVAFWVDAAETEGILENEVEPEELLWQKE